MRRLLIALGCALLLTGCETVKNVERQREYLEETEVAVGVIAEAVTGQAPFQIGYDAVNLALDVIDGKEVEFDLIIPTILFARGDDASIDMFVETDGRAVFAE